jgi:uncharacterized membrane protein
MVVVAVSLFTLRRPLLGGALLAAGICLKFYPILLLPPILIFTARNGISKARVVAVLGLGLVGLVGYLSWLLAGSNASMQYYLTQYTPVTWSIVELVSSPVTAIASATVFLIVFYSLVGFFAKPAKSPLAVLVTTLMVYYAISSMALYHPQYLIWAMPFLALDIALEKRSRALLFAFFNTLAFVLAFYVSSAFLTPSSYSLLMFPLGGENLPWYSVVVTTLLESYSVTLLLPLISSAFYACVLIYAVDLTRSWFGVPQK